MSIKLRAQVTDARQLTDALDSEDIEFAVAPPGILGQDTPDKERIIIVPPVFLGGEEKRIFRELTDLRRLGFRRILVHTPGHIALAREAKLIPHGSFRLNITNSLALKQYEQLGLTDTVISAELTLAQGKSLKRSIPLGILGYGRVPVMVTRRCPVTNGSLCKKSGKGICKNHITDRKNTELSLSCDTAAEILNNHVLVLSDKMEKISDFDFLIMNFTDEKDIKEVIKNYLTGKKPEGTFTRGLYFKGVI